MDKITTTIRRPWLAEIISGEKRVEYREMKAYWRRKLDGVSRPFLLRLINGMEKRAPEVTVVIDRVLRNRAKRHYGLHIKRVVEYRNWDARHARPTGARASGAARRPRG